MKAITLKVLGVDDERYTTDGFVVPRTHGTFAVTRALGEKNVWALTHVPTGCGIVSRRALAERWSRARAIRFAKKVREVLPLPVFETDYDRAKICFLAQHPKLGKFLETA